MSKKLYVALLPVLAVAMFAIAPAVAQAAPKWEVCLKEHGGSATKFSDSECQKELAAGKWEWVEVGGATAKVQVITFGKLKLTAATGLVIECKVIDAGNIWNAGGVGKDEITAFTNYDCKATPAEDCLEPEIATVAKSLVWTTELVEVGTTVFDKIATAAKPIEVTVLCGKVAKVTYHGTLEPSATNPTEAHPLQFAFSGTTGELENEAKTEKAKVEGKDSLITEEDQQVKVS
jgi:hypothetical protein